VFHDLSFIHEVDSKLFNTEIMRAHNIKGGFYERVN
jgi:hypothetical protein